MNCFQGVKIFFGFAFLFVSQAAFSQNLSSEKKNKLAAEGASYLAKSKATAIYDSSIYYLQEALQRFKRIEDRRNMLNCYNRLCTDYYYIQEYLKYQEYALKAWEFAQTHFDEKDPGFSNALSNLPAYFIFKEDYFKALEVLKKNLELTEQDSNSFKIALAANNIGYVYSHYISDYERAMQYYTKSIRLFADSGIENRRFMAFGYSNIGNCLKEKQLPDSAYTICQKTLGILSHLEATAFNERTQWYCYQNIADIYQQKGQQDSCFFYAQKALELIERNKSISDPQLTYQTLGDYYLSEEKYDKAIPYFEKAVALTSKNPEVHKPVTSACHLAQVLLETKAYDAALDTLQKTLQLLSPDFVSSDIYAHPSAESMLHKKSGLEVMETKATAFYQKYLVQSNQKDLKAALENFQVVSEIIGLLRQEYTEEVSKNILAQKAIAVYEKAIEVALELHQLSGDKRYLEEAFMFAEKNKSVLLLESIQENTAMGFGNLPDSIMQKEKTLKGEVAFYNKLIYLEKQKKEKAKPETTNELEAKLFTAKEDYQDFIDFLETHFPLYYELKYSPQIATAAKIQSEICDAQTLLLEYFVGEKQAFLFCITQKDIQVVRISNDQKLHDSFDLLQAVWTTPPNGENYTSHLEQFNRQSPYLFQRLLESGLSHFSKKITKLIVIPDDFINYLPFELLSYKQDQNPPNDFTLAQQHYLLEDFQISYNYSASLLLQNHLKKYQTTKSFAGFAPVFKEQTFAEARSCDNGELYRLQCNEKEVESINALMYGEIFIGEAANKAQFIALDNQFDILHLATHACLDPDNPQFNRIYFSDTYLSNFDLANQSLRTNLVVLSACNTSSGTLVKGDGVMSLSRGFTLAGCPSTLTSLWAVDDCSTSQLMIHFYQHLQMGENKDAALQAAKIDYLQASDKATAHPYFWAPFLQFGNTMPLSSNGFSWWYLGGFLLFLVLFFLWKNR